MKKILSALLFLQLLVFALMAPNLSADERREFILKQSIRRFKSFWKTAAEE